MDVVSWQLKNRKQCLIKINCELCWHPLLWLKFRSNHNLRSKTKAKAPKDKWKNKIDDQKCPTINTFWMIFHCFLGICRHGVPFEIKAIKKWTCVISKIRFIKCVREHKRVNVVMKRNKNVPKKRPTTSVPTQYFSTSQNFWQKCAFCAAAFVKSFRTTPCQSNGSKQ